MVGGRHGQLLDAWGMSADHPDPLVAPVALPSRSIPWSVLCVDRHLHTAHCAGAAGALPSVRTHRRWQPALTHDSLVGVDLQMEANRWTMDPDQPT